MHVKQGLIGISSLEEQCAHHMDTQLFMSSRIAKLFSKDPEVFWEVNRTLLCTKSQHWEYEREWRFVINEGDKAFRIPGELNEVIFGAKCEQADRDEIMRLCRGRFSPRF
jgi:hypothetical protein